MQPLRQIKVRSNAFGRSDSAKYAEELRAEVSCRARCIEVGVTQDTRQDAPDWGGVWNPSGFKMPDEKNKNGAW